MECSAAAGFCGHMGAAKRNMSDGANLCGLHFLLAGLALGQLITSEQEQHSVPKCKDCPIQFITSAQSAPSAVLVVTIVVLSIS